MTATYLWMAWVSVVVAWVTLVFCAYKRDHDLRRCLVLEDWMWAATFLIWVLWFAAVTL